MNSVFLIIFALLQALDIWTTVKALKMGAREVNPILAKAFNYADPILVMVTIKLLGAWALWYADMYVITGLACAVYLWVIDNNLRVIRKG